MHRFPAILFILATVAVCGLLLPAPAAAQTNDSGVLVKQDGDSVLLIPPAGKAYLVFAHPRNGGQKGAPGQVSYLAREQRISVKEFSKLVIFELALKEGAEVALEAGKTGLLPGKPCACDFPWPPPPECPGCAVSTFLLFPSQDPGAANRK